MGCKRAILVSSVAIMMVVIIGLAPANALEGGDWVGTWHKIKLKLKNVCEFDGLDPLYKIKSGGPAWIYIRNWDGVDTYGATLMLASMDDQWIPSGFTLTRIDGTAADGLLQSSNIAFIDDNIGEEIELSFVVRLKGKAKEGELKSGKILNVVGLAKLKYPFAECFASMTCSGKLVKENKVPPDIYAAKNSSKIFTIAGEVAQCSFHDSTPRTGIASDGTKFLVVTRRWDDSLKGLIGVLLSSGGQVIKEFVIAPWGARPAVAFDGTNYLVVYTV
ncbi:MAG: hypothetical protein QNJ04_16235, partial [Desulfobacterales bacterium]|nr:hypothetical protein [Desulfobacterales bacterium]